MSSETCATCGIRIELVPTLHGFVWSDGSRSDPTVCFSAYNLRHRPVETP